MKGRAIVILIRPFCDRNWL